MTTTVKAPARSSAAPTAARFPLGGLAVLATAVFMAVTAEVLPTGLLPEMSADLHASESQIGLLVTYFAVAVVCSAVPLVAVTRRFPRHTLIVGVLLVVAITSILSAVAPDYTFLAVVRVLGGMAHGLFWAVVGTYSVHLVPKHQIGRAVAITSGGGTAAFVLGVPLGTMLGQAFTWRVPFAVIGVLALFAALLILKKLPRVSPAERERSRRGGVVSGAVLDAPPTLAAHRGRFDATVPAVALLCLVVATLIVGQNTLYTYITPFMISSMGVPASSVGLLLFVYGVAGALGLVLAGVVFSRRPTLGVAVGLVCTAVSVTVLTLFTSNIVVSVVAFAVWGASFGLIPSLMQARLLHIASPAIRDTANAFYSTSFNVGIAGGAFLGGILLNGAGLGALPVTYLVLMVVAGVLLVISWRIARRH
ncbi:MFS transporter [Subtercola vilae]|nr:MFS transporter [Subtercola vilae]